MLAQDLERRPKAVSLARAVVERGGNRVTAILGEPLHRVSLREVLTNQAVGIFVRPSLP